MLQLFFLLNPVLITAAESSRAFTTPDPAQPANSPIKHPNTPIGKLSNGNTSEANYVGSAASCDTTEQLQAIYHSILSHRIRKFIKTNTWLRNSGKDCRNNYRLSTWYHAPIGVMRKFKKKKKVMLAPLPELPIIDIIGQGAIVKKCIY